MLHKSRLAMEDVYNEWGEVVDVQTVMEYGTSEQRRRAFDQLTQVLSLASTAGDAATELMRESGGGRDSG